MIKGESYDVISDIYSWKDEQLQDFFEATKAAIRKGVIVRRIFNLFQDQHEGEGREPLSTIEVETILRRHLIAMNESRGRKNKPGYKVAVFGPSERNNPAAEAVKHITEAKLRKMHFGIFNLMDERGKMRKVRFRVEKPDLSELLINPNPDEVQEDVNNFHSLWEHSALLTADRIQEIAAAINAKMKQKS